MNTEITIELRNRSPMKFTGEEIAFVSTQREDEPRWTEMRIYRTAAGAYVFRRTGRSVMYHRPACGRIFGRMDMTMVDEPDEDWIPCDECLPDSDDEAVMLESDKEHARMAADVRQLVYAVQQRHRDTHELTLTPLGRQLLETAAETDPRIIDAVRERMLAAANGE